MSDREIKVDHFKQNSNLSIFFQKGLFQHNDQFKFTKVYRLIFFFKCDTINILPKNCKLYGQTYNRN